MTQNNTNNSRNALLLFLGTLFITFFDFIISIFHCDIINEFDGITWLFYIASALSFASLYSVFILVTIFIPIYFLSKNIKIASITYIVVAILIQCILLIDIHVYCLYKFHINSNIIDLIVDGGSEVFVFDYQLILKVLGIICILAVIPYLIVYKLSVKFTVSKKVCKKLIYTIIIVTILGLAISFIGYAYSLRKQKISIIKTLQTIPFFQADLYNTTYKMWSIVSQDELDKFMFQVIYGELQYPKKEIISSDSIPQYNILYILIDSWNPKAFDSIVTPNIYSFANNKSHQFQQHYSLSNGTHYSINNIFYSLPSNPLYAISREHIRPVFIDQLDNRGYQIQCFSSATMVNQYIFSDISNMKFDTEGNTPFDRDNQLTSDFKKFISNKNDEPFFSLLFYDTAHAIALPEEYNKKFQPAWSNANYLALNNETDVTPFFNLYKNCIYHIDHLVGEILGELENQGLLENTVVIITGDHGQEFNENKKNYWGHYGNYSKWQLQVPFIFYHPSIQSPQSFEHMTTHNDIVPTVLNHFLGVKNELSDYSVGYDLYDATDRYPLLCENYHNQAILLDNIIITANNSLKISEVTNNELNTIDKTSVDLSKLEKIREQQEHFFFSDTLIEK